LKITYEFSFEITSVTKTAAKIFFKVQSEAMHRLTSEHQCTLAQHDSLIPIQNNQANSPIMSDYNLYITTMT